MKFLQQILLLSSFISVLLISASCDKDSEFSATGEELEFYVLDTFKTFQNSDQIIDSTVVLNDTALINYQQIISYDSENYVYTVNESVADALNEEGGLKYFYKAFAVCLDKEVIYTGYFWPTFSSSIKQWFVIDPVQYFNTSELKIQKAYPSDNYAGTYPDLRNDERIIGLLKRDGKLKD
jgi:hypothetical protein